MLRNLIISLLAILLSYATSGLAGDYVLDASTMGVGATEGENLVVKEGCLNYWETSCPETEKVRFLSSTYPTKVGSVQVIGQLSGDFEVILMGYFDSKDKGINILTDDNKGFGLSFKDNYHSFSSNGIGKGGDNEYGDLPGLSDGSSEIKIMVQKGVANVYTNGTIFPYSTITLDQNTIFSRVTIVGITTGDRISEIKVRGIQGSTTCSSTPTTPTSSSDCTADYSVSGSLHVPCVRVPGAFGKTEIYDVWMQQKFPTYSFDLDLNRVTVK